MGEDISQLHHVSSFRRFWTKSRNGEPLSALEASNLLPDFERVLLVTGLNEAA